MEWYTLSQYNTAFTTPTCKVIPEGKIGSHQWHRSVGLFLQPWRLSIAFPTLTVSSETCRELSPKVNMGLVPMEGQFQSWGMQRTSNATIDMVTYLLSLRLDNVQDSPNKYDRLKLKRIHASSLWDMSRIPREKKLELRANCRLTCNFYLFFFFLIFIFPISSHPTQSNAPSSTSSIKL